MRPVELFVAVLGASNYTYVEATDTQRSADFIQSHSHAVEYVGGVPAATVPDQLRTGIRDPCRYEPILQRTYEEWAAHYSTAIVPRDRRSLVIRPRRKSAFKWRNAGSSRGSGMRPSFRSRR